MEKSTKSHSFDQVCFVEIPGVSDPRGNLSYIQFPTACPFQIERVYWIYDVCSNAMRHGRALKTTDELLVVLSGAFDVETNDGCGAAMTCHLDKCNKGLFIPHGTWREIKNFAPNSVVMVLASKDYFEDDYIRDYESYVEFKSVKP